MASMGAQDEEQCLLPHDQPAIAARGVSRPFHAVVLVAAVALAYAAVAALASTGPRNSVAVESLLREDGLDGEMHSSAGLATLRMLPGPTSQTDEAGVEPQADSVPAAAERQSSGEESVTDGASSSESTLAGNASAEGEAAKPGWYLAEIDQNCHDACGARGLFCDEAGLHAKRAEIDSDEAMGQTISVLGKTCHWFNDTYGSEGDVPVIDSAGVCFVSDPDREEESWSCSRTPWPPATEELSKQRLCMCSAPCTANGESCLDSQCCSEWGMTCFRKNEHWASCNKTCAHNMKWVNNMWEEQDEKVWDCHALSAPAGIDPCSANGENCTESKCCSEPGMTCFKKDEHWSSCNSTCSHNMLWTDNRWQEQAEKVWDCDVVAS